MDIHEESTDQVRGEDLSACDDLLADWLAQVFPDCKEPQQDLRSTLMDNPGRISRAYRELLGGYMQSPEGMMKVVLELPEETYTGLVSSVGIPFCSFCAHHFLPFYGTIDIVYQPRSYIIGIGKMPRLVECRARRFQLQELLVKEICEDMIHLAGAAGAYVRSVAKHLCVCHRGPSVHPVTNATSYSLGTLGSEAGQMRAIELLQEGA